MGKKISNTERAIMEKHRTTTKYGWSMDSDDMANAANEIAAAREAKYEDNKAEVERLDAKLEELKARVDELKAERDAGERIVAQFEAERRNAWKTVAKELGIHKYMTNNGQLSKAKARKADDLHALLDTYNTQYVKRVNELMNDISGRAEAAQAPIRESLAEYNRRANEYNNVARQRNRLLELD